MLLHWAYIYVDCDLDRVCIHKAKGRQKFSHLLCGHLDMNRVLKGKQISWIFEIYLLHPKIHKTRRLVLDAGGEWMRRLGWCWALSSTNALSKITGLVQGISNLLLGYTNQTATCFSPTMRGICCKGFWLVHAVLHLLIRTKPVQAPT